jgi:hypothetical protein
MNPKHDRFTWLLLTCAFACITACGGDDDDDDDNDSGATVCGDGIINGTEECDGDQLGAATCASAGDFTGGELACADDCTFDTSGCTVDGACGNGVIDTGEDCDGDELGDATCATAGAFTGGDLVCADDCSFDTSGCEVSPSGLIANARNAADASGLALPITGALVTYIKPALGQDPAGIFIQAEATGPAIFVAVAAADLDPKLAVGDSVSFTVTEKATQAGQPRVVAVDDFAIDSSGGDVEALIQDVSAEATLVSALNDFDSELIKLDATIISDFAGAGNPAVAANISTAGIADGTDLRFRVDGGLRDTLDLANGCVISVGPTPLWRFNDVAQPSIWAAGEAIISSCPAPQVGDANAPAATTVTVSFDRRIDPASLAAEDFTFDGELVATAAEISESDPRAVVVTTETQVAQRNYTVTVAGVTDTRGSAVDPKAAAATFVGFGDVEIACDDGEDNDADGDIDCQDADCSEETACEFPDLFISEIDPQNDGDDAVEFIEVTNSTGAAIDLAVQGWYLLLVNGSDDLTYDVIRLGPTGTIPAGGSWVVGSATVAGVDQIEFTTNSFQNGADGLLLARCDQCAGANDFSTDGNDFDPTTGTTFTSDSGREGTKVDAIAYDNGDADDTALWAKLNNITAAIAAQLNENDDGTAETESLHRTSVSGWVLDAISPGN